MNVENIVKSLFNLNKLLVIFIFISKLSFNTLDLWCCYAIDCIAVHMAATTAAADGCGQGSSPRGKVNV